jgi:sulfoxide reductase heme-binding subunit YedZ
MTINSLTTSLKEWPKGIRLYIALATLLVTAEVYWYTNTVYDGSSLAAIRLQEIYAWIALSLLLISVSIGPAYKTFTKIPGKSLLFDARRMLGVSAAWFASLHVLISYFDQFGGANPFKLPDAYKLAFAVGLIALLVLLAMTATSFNAAFRKLGIWWFRIHRLVYLAILLILFHAFNIGVHASTLPFIVALVTVVGLIFAMHFYLMFGTKGKPATNLQSLTLCYGLLLTVSVFAFGITQGGQNVLR